ncbi:MAG: multicomponent Na+:H+ antiporter subunit C [Pseudohongiellaceae bacterium]|jgi:multicomponent Na+:H+ antiporter subunit C
MIEWLALYNDWAVIVIMMSGFYIMIARYNLVKKIIGLSIFQTGIFYFYVGLGKVDNGTAPILVEPSTVNGVVEEVTMIYSNPLPHVLILTAIVVSVATMAVGLALIVRIYEKYGSIEEDDIQAIDNRHICQLDDSN